MRHTVPMFRVGQIWHYRFTVDGQRVQRSTRESIWGLAAVVAEDAFKAAKLRSRGLEPEPTLEVLATLWVQSHVLILSEARVRTVETIAKLHFGSLKGLKLQELTTAQVETARLEYLKDHKKSSANTWLACLRALVGWAVKRGMIRYVPWQVNPLKVQQKPKVILPVAKAADWMSSVEQLGALEPGIILVIQFMIGLGLRISESLGAQWEWLDFERGIYTPGATKGREAWPRPVPVWLLDRLKPIAKLAGPIIPIRPGHPITDGRVANLMKRVNRTCGLLPITPHRLRGTYATWLIEIGVPIQDVQRAMGHKDVRTTMRYLEAGLKTVAAAQVSFAERLGMARRGIGEPSSQEPRTPSNPDFLGRIPESEGK